VPAAPDSVRTMRIAAIFLAIAFSVALAQPAPKQTPLAAGAISCPPPTSMTASEPDPGQSAGGGKGPEC